MNKLKLAIEKAAIENGIELQSELNNFTGDLTFRPNYIYSLIDKNGVERYQIADEQEAEEVIEKGKNYDGYPAVKFFFEDKTYYFVKQ